MQKILLIALGGACGALARYGLGGVVQKTLGDGFPWGTAVVNILGCGLFGVFWALAVERGHFNAEIRALVLVGFLGSFTTFSTFIFETGHLMTDSELFAGLANIAFQIIAGIFLFFLGLNAGRIL